MAERDYSHRDVLDKLGIKPGHTVALDPRAGQLEPALAARILDRTGRSVADGSHPVDVALVTLDGTHDAAQVLKCWRARISPAGGIWLLTPKRGQPGYVDQRDLIEAGKLAGVVDNKVCSVSDTMSAMRFVIRKQDRLRDA